ncbi:transmembrane protein KIAA1109 homolog isoform X2 [Amblyraja radiata]|uniref:transmembrane protein KIAA1109 homolog isoform X2 n=1 Tax=Amblyraja radiata TaxID=386614 RepID=UPI0014036149|nr:transmembrane protein KIAA1109 homolog isoform X2 [Amblyraja radiata]
MEANSRKNESFVPSFTDLDGFLTEHNSNVVWLIVATILSCGWIIYLTYYNSRNLGLILTQVLNRLYKNGYVHIGSFSFSVLSGKVMFREIYYINEDVSIRIQDGFLIFRWWKMYNPKQKQHDPKAETRLYITVNGFEFHVYNRYDLYAHLQQLFGLEPTIIPKRANTKLKKNREKAKSKLESIATETQDPSSSWRSLIPVIKVDINTGRLAFGNRFLPQTLGINFDDAFLTYTTKLPSSHLDQFMHIVKGKLENVRVMLVPSPRHVSLQNDEPPRLMGEGFVVMQSNDVDIYYYMDEPGIVPEETGENAEESPDNENTKLQDLPPCWGLDIVCGKGTDFNYGPWADRQREYLWKFFFPADYQKLKITEVAKPRKPRQILAFELRMNIIADATIDLLFTKNRETNAIHVNVGAGSYLEVNVPMTVDENGFSPTVKGQLLHVDATSSMLYRTLLESEMLAFQLNAIYQRTWNMPQEWQCEIEVYKATYHFIFAQKNFFTDLIQDWSSDSAPDIYSFVPYICKLKVMFHQFEMIWAANQHNWIDCSTKQQENVYLAACGETLNIEFSLPFNNFIPESCNTKFYLKAENIDLRLFLPDCHPSRYATVTLVNDSQPNKVTPQPSTSSESQSSQKARKLKWRNVTQPETDWIECWSVPTILLSIDYTWHPIYPQKADEQLKQSFETQQMTSRSSQKAADRIVHSPTVSQKSRIDPAELLPDKLHVELEMAPDSQIILYGALLKALLCIKENYFGEDDMYTDFEEAITSPVMSLSTSSSSGWTAVGVDEHDKKETEGGSKHIHPLTLRPWDISVLINLYKVHGRLPVHCSGDGSECPTAFLERLCFEMTKGHKETLLQLILSPVYIFVSDNYPRPSVDGLLREGHISLSGMQLRAHAMFSAEGLPLSCTTLEYAWLIDVQAGLLTAKVTLPQLATLFEWGQTFIFHVMCQEYELERPKSLVVCQHGVDQRFCDFKLKSVPGPCQRSDDLKYIMTRIGIDGADLFIVEHGCAGNLKVGAIRIGTCNLHNQAVGEGVSAVMQDVRLKQYIEQLENSRLGVQSTVLRRSYWLETGSVTFGLITADVALAADHPAKHEVQRLFLETHDNRTKRLWFLWSDDDITNKQGRNKCGCLGGCKFFAGTCSGLEFFKLDEMTPSTSSAHSTMNADLEMFYGQSLLQPNEWIITKDTSKTIDGKTNGAKRKEWDSRSLGTDSEKKNQHNNLQVPLQSHSSTSSSEENSSSTAALPLLASEKNSPSSHPDDNIMQMHLPPLNTDETVGSGATDVPGSTPVSPNNQDKSIAQSPLKRQASVSSTRLGSTKSLSAAIFSERQLTTMGVQFTSEVSRSDENVLDSPRQRKSFGSFPFTPSADSNTFHQYRSVDSSISVADSEAYYSAAEDFDPVSSDEGPGTYPGRKKRRRTQAVDYSRNTIYRSVEGSLTSSTNGENQELKNYPIKAHASQASFVSALEGEGEITDHVYIAEGEKTVDNRQLTRQQIVMACYLNYLTQLQVSNWSVKQPTNKRTSKSSLHRPLDLDTPTSEDTSSSFDQLSVPMFKVIKQGLAASALLDRGSQLMGADESTPYTPLERTIIENTEDETVTEQWSLDQPATQTRTTAIIEVKGAVDVVLSPLVTEAFDRYFEAMVHFSSIWHPSAIVDNLHVKVLNEALLNSKSASSDPTTAKHEGRGSKIENGTTGTTKSSQLHKNPANKQDNVKIKGLQANVSIPKVNLCLLQATMEEPPTFITNKNITHVSLVALCFDRISTQILFNRGIVEDGSNNPDAGRASVAFDKYVNASKMQPQSSGSLRSNAGAERGKELAAKLNVHRIHGQLRGLSTTDLGTCAITAIPFEKSKVLFTLEELEDFSFTDDTEQLKASETTKPPQYVEKWGWILFECGIENLTIKGGRQSGAVLYNVLGVLGKSNTAERSGMQKSGDSTGSPTGSGYSTDVSEDNLPRDNKSPTSENNGNSASDDQDEGVESDDLKKDLPLMPPPPDSSSMKLTMSKIWFSFAAPTNLHSRFQIYSRQQNLLSTATPGISAWLIPVDQLKSSWNKVEMERTLRVCAVMGCIMTEALERKSVHFPLKSKYNRVNKLARYLQENPSCLLCNILHRYLQQADYSIIEDATMNNGLPALVTLKKGLVALARQWMKFIVVTPAFKGVSLLLRPAQLPKPQPATQAQRQTGGVDNGGAIQSDTSADGAEFEFDAATVSEHTMLLESSRPQGGGTTTGPVTGSDIMRKLSKTNAHTHESTIKIKGVHPYQSLSYTSGDTVADSPAHINRAGLATKESPRKESLLSYLTGSFPSLHNLLDGNPQSNATVIKNSSLTQQGNIVATEMQSEHPLLSEPSSVSFYNWMSNAVSNRGSISQESPVPRTGHNTLSTGLMYNLPTIQSASDFNTMLSSDQNTLDGTQSRNSTSQDEIVGIEEGNQGPPAVQLADAQVVFKPLLSNTGIQSQDVVPLTYGMYFGKHLSFSGCLDCLRADIVDSDTSKERKIRKKRRQGMINLPPLDFKPALMFNTFCINAVVMDRPTCNQNSTNALSFHELNRHHQNTFHVNFTVSCQSISQHVDMALVRLIHQFSTMVDDIKTTQTDIKLSRYTAGSVSPTPTFKTRKHRDFRSSDFSRSSRGSLNGGVRGNSTKANKRLGNENSKRESRNKNSSGPTQRRTSKVSRKGSKDVADHVTIHMDDSDSITVSEQSEPSAECWQNMYKLLNFYSLISDPTGILEKTSPDVLHSAGGRSPTDPGCKVIFENEQESSSPNKLSRKRSLVNSEPQHVTLIMFGVGMVNRTHLEADIGGLTMEAELKKIHGSFTVKEKMKDVLHQKMTETCATAHIGGVNIVLLEGITPNIQLEDFPTSPTSTGKQEFLTVVKCSIAKSQALYSAQRGLKTNNTMVIKVGAISINIPQHPATLHSMMVRSSHQLSKQISDLIRQPLASMPVQREDVSTPQSSEKPPSSVNQTPVETNEFPQLPEGLEKKPIVLKFSALLDGITIGAALLPSLKAEYKMGRMKSHGMTGAQTRFTFELPTHRLRFQSKVTPVDMAALPPSASLNLPQVTMSGEYIMEERECHSDKSWNADEFPLKQCNYLQGNYLRCVAEVGSFEHNLTTDLLNQLVFLQKVFMKEVNEVIQKVSGGEQPIPLWNEHDILMDGEKPKILLYSLNLQFKGIQVTATTPSMRAVRLETGLIELELSNRIQAKTQLGAGLNSSYLKLFGKCQVDLNLALGQIVKHQVYEEAGSDFHQVAYFKTRIGLRNALQEEISGAFDREAVLITLSRPIIYAQPVAFDRAVFFWLNYKAAYDNWNEQRMALHKDIHVATKEVVDKLPGIQQTSAQAFGTLFLQLTVNDLGICLPITNTIQANHTIDFDPGSAMVLTIESTLITACSSESLVSKGHFKNFCIRFADGFETSWDDWKPELQGDLVMNACVVPDGTYEVCSRTAGLASADSSSAGTWTLNILWKMCGIDVHMDPNIGKRLSALGNTMTTLTGEEESDDIADLNSVNNVDITDEDEPDTMSPTIMAETNDYRRQGIAGSQTADGRGRKSVKRLVDIRELNEQAKVIDDLKKLGASEGTINQEIQRYQQLESVAVNDIRRDVRKKLRRSSMRAASLKDKWGLGYKPSYNRSKSISASGRPPLRRPERSSSRVNEVEDAGEVQTPEQPTPGSGPRVSFKVQEMLNDTALALTRQASTPKEGYFQFPEETEMDLLSVTIDSPSNFSSVSERSVFSSSNTPRVAQPRLAFQLDDAKRDDSLTSSSEESDREEEYEKEKIQNIRRTPLGVRKKSPGFAAVQQLFSDRWPSAAMSRNSLNAATERNIDFELDVRVEIESGKCVLHPTTQQPQQMEHDELNVKKNSEKILKNVDQDTPSKKKKPHPNYTSNIHLSGGKKVPHTLQTKTTEFETTVFYIPGVDVKLHYNSKTLKTDSPNASRGSSLPRTLSKESKLYGMKDTSLPSQSTTTSTKPTLLLPPQLPPIPSAKGKGTGGVKTAKLYAWVALQSLPEEMVISPCLLDFLEKALETIPITPIERNYTALSSQDEDVGQFEVQDALEESTISLVSSSTSAYSSFPVDVVVYIRVQPSQIKFSCLPVSRVECMLKLPSLDLVFSSNRSELESLGFSHAFDGTQVSASATSLLAHTVLKAAASKSGTSSGFGSPLGRSRHSSSQSDLSYSSTTASGLSFTACMSDFSLYVFHPYGTGKQKTTVTGLTPGTSAAGAVDDEASSVTGRKDSLSINLEFVKVSLSRMRRSGGGSLFDNQTPIKTNSKMETTLINISAVCDIGSASFKYDMRRLSEILAFPRAWYRRSIARRLFLGDQTINFPASGPVTPDSLESQHLSPESTRKAYWRTWDQTAQSSSYSHVAQTANVFNDHASSNSTSPAGMMHSVKSPSVIRSRTISDSSASRRDSITKISTTAFNKNGKLANQQAAPWETLVVFAINLKQLNVQMNMSNVMGNTTWTTSGLKSQGRLSVGSKRDREISMSVGLGRSQLDSKGGVVGGTIDVNTLEMVSHISEHPNQQPSHKIQITLGSTDARVDYMGSSILMGIFSNADLQLQDEWKVNLYSTVDLSITEKSEVFVHGDLQWDIFQVMISRSTTPDLIKIGMKLQEFFTQQFDTSKRALSTWGPVLYVPPKTPVINVERSSNEHLLDAAHHRHWPEILKVIAGCQISLFQMPLPEDAVQLGGSMSLHGNHMTLACFHGPNFRSKSWALFHLEEPNIAFWTEAQKIWEDGASDHSTYIVQTLDFHLGHNTMVTKPGGALESPMATITKITRRRHENPPHGVATVQEWFNYVTAMRNEELNLLRNVNANTVDHKATIKSSSLLSGFRGTANYNHETETIFALPRMQLDFKSIHMQEPQEPSLQDANSKPKVECSVVTEFTDHICVTMDAELIMFLHDLVSAYLKEKEKAIFPPRVLAMRSGQKSPIISHDDRSTNKNKEEVIYTTVDWREFVCNTWHLEPTLRLISWTGRKIDPVGVDYILQKLGFHHARITIPKWVQRGVMDPLDKVLSVLIKKLGVALQDEKEKKGKDKEEHPK